MYDILFYIFFFICIFSAIYIAFSSNTAKSVFAVLLLLITVRGIFVMLISELFALIGILALIMAASLILIFFPRFENFLQKGNNIIPSTNFSMIIAISLLAAIVSGLLTSTRWRLFDINYEINSYILIFSKYLPAILALTFIVFIIITSLGFILKKGISK